jgi:hypothetical protein
MSTTPEVPTPRTVSGERIAANAALLRLFKNTYRESSDRHSDSLFVRDYVEGLERELATANARAIHLPSQTFGDGTSGGTLSVFARGWNGCLQTVREMNPNAKFTDACLDESRKHHGNLTALHDAIAYWKDQWNKQTADRDAALAQVRTLREALETVRRFQFPSLKGPTLITIDSALAATAPKEDKP